MDELMGISVKVSKSWTLWSVTKTLISAQARQFQTFSRDALMSVIDCYLGTFLEDGHTMQLGTSTKKYRVYDKMKEGWLVLVRKERERDIKEEV